MVGVPGGSVIRNPPSSAGDVGSILSWEDPLEKGMATHSSILAWTDSSHGQRSLGAIVHGVTESQTRLSN